MRRGWSRFADTRQNTHPTSTIRTRVFSRFSQQCVGGDVHLVGVSRHLNDPRIFGTRIVVTFDRREPRRVSTGAGASGAKQSQPASAPRACTSATLEFRQGGCQSADRWRASGFFRRCCRSVLLDFFPTMNFRGVLPRIQHRCDISGVAIDPVINPVGKSRGKEPMMIPPQRMNAAKRCDGINVRPDRIQKIPSQSLLLVLVKTHAPFEVPLCRGKDRDFHA
jgi:hypothetical protein